MFFLSVIKTHSFSVKMRLTIFNYGFISCALWGWQFYAPAAAAGRLIVWSKIKPPNDGGLGRDRREGRGPQMMRNHPIRRQFYKQFAVIGKDNDDNILIEAAAGWCDEC